MTLHGFGKWRVQPTRLLPLALESVSLQPDRLNMRDVSELFWSLAMMHARGQAVDHAVAALMSRCRALFATGGESAPHLFGRGQCLSMTIRRLEAWDCDRG